MRSGPRVAPFTPWPRYAAMHRTITHRETRYDMATKQEGGGTSVRIKKYANRRLYNTATSSYVTLEDLSRMVQEGTDFTVEDAKTGEDLTRAVLTQIIVEEEQKGDNLLPISFLRQLIALYGDSMRFMVPQYLESTMDWFTQHQDEMRKQMQTSFGGAFPFGSLEDMQKQNMALFEQAMRMFNPFVGAPGAKGRGPVPTGAQQEGAQQEGERQEGERQGGKPASGGSIDDLRRQLAEMQRQLDSLSDDKNR